MNSSNIRSIFALIVMTSAILAAPRLATHTAQEQQEALPPPRDIPGITVEDKYPNACVDCHINMPERNQDERLTTLMSAWYYGTDDRIMKMAKAAAPPDLKLMGLHPPLGAAASDVPNSCITCHRKPDKNAPPFAAMIHKIHLTGDKDNHFLTIFEGQCTHCHKFNPETGVWKIPSAPERE